MAAKKSLDLTIVETLWYIGLCVFVGFGMINAEGWMA